MSFTTSVRPLSVFCCHKTRTSFSGLRGRVCLCACITGDDFSLTTVALNTGAAVVMEQVKGQLWDP